MTYKRIDNEDAETLLKRLHGVGVKITVTPGATNVATFTIQFPKKGVRAFDMYMSTNAAGGNISGTTYSTGLAVTTGTQALALTANKFLSVLTDATGKAVITLTATAKPVGEYLCVISASGYPTVSAATVTGSYG